MANITETNDWPAGVYQYAIGDIVDGGPDSLETLPLRQLAHRSLFQRLRNVTPWDSVLAGLYGYPQGACVMHAGVSWRSLVANNGVEPGTDDTRWERWAFSLDELETWLASYLPYGAPIACANTGPVLATADRARIHKSPLGEYWMWLGDAWQVIAGRASVVVGAVSVATPANVLTTVAALTAPRNGKAYLRGHVSNLNGYAGANQVQAYIRRTRAGVTTSILDSLAESTVAAVSQYMQPRCFSLVDAQVGDTYTLVAIASGGRTVSPDSDSGIYLEYR